MPEPVRVRDNVTGHEYSTYAVTEDGKVDDGLTVIKDPAVDERGELIPPKYPEPKKTATPAAASSPKPPAARPANTEEH